MRVAKHTFITIALVTTLGLVIAPAASAASAAGQLLVTFNSPTDLTDNFTPGSNPVFTNQTAGGINNTGSVNVPVPSNDLWTSKAAYSISGAGDVYKFSAYFKVAQNGGYGNLGFTNQVSSNPDSYGQPATGIGVNFHGGGGAFVNNGVMTDLSWPPDLVLGNWYFFTFDVADKGSNTFDLDLKIYNTDATGALGTLKTQKTLAGVVNTTLGSATKLHSFFSAAGARMSAVDNFAVALEGGASFIGAGQPVVIASTEAADVTAYAASLDANVTDQQGAAVTARGVCYGTSPAPDTSDTCVASGTGLGAFTVSLSDLQPNTTYYARAYATNANGTSYSVESTFTTLDGPVITPPADNSGGSSASPTGNGPASLSDLLAATGTNLPLLLIVALGISAAGLLLAARFRHMSHK